MKNEKKQSAATMPATENATATVYIGNYAYDSIDSVRANVKKSVGEVGHTLSETATDNQIKFICKMCDEYAEKVDALKTARDLYNDTYDRKVEKDNQAESDRKFADLIKTKQEISALCKECKALAKSIACYVVTCRERGTAIRYLCGTMSFTYWTCKEDKKTGKLSTVTATARLAAHDFSDAALPAMGADPEWIVLLEGLSALMVSTYCDPCLSKRAKKFVENVHISVSGQAAKDRMLEGKKITFETMSNKARCSVFNAIVKAMIGSEYAVSTAIARAICAAGITARKNGTGATIWNEIDWADFFTGICADIIRVKNGEEAVYAFTYSAAKAAKAPETETTTTTETTTEKPAETPAA